MSITMLRGLWVLLLAAVCLGAAGCATTEQAAGGDMPWNVQQSWEGSVSVPGFSQDR
jgi:hypothetical protein